MSNERSSREALLPIPMANPAQGPRLTVFDLLVARVSAHAVEHAATSEEMILNARARVAHARLRAEDEENELRLHRQAANLPPPAAQAILREDIAVQRLLLERSRIRALRLGQRVPDTEPSPPPVVVRELPPPAAVPILERDLSDRDIEVLAQRALTHAAELPAAERSAFWQRWETRLAEKLPPYPAAEVRRRAEQLRQMIDAGGDTEGNAPSASGRVG
jgi:hypothetical protein